MKHLILFVLAIFTALNAEALPVKRLFQDVLLPTQKVLERQTVDNVAISNASTVKASGYAGPTSAAAVTLTSFTAQPDVPRSLSFTPGGTTGDIESCVITVTGTNIKSAVITETFTFSANATGKVSGNKAFKTVTSVAWPADCESGGFAATWSIGTENKIGLQSCMDSAGDFDWSVFDNAKETAPTCTADADEVEKNVCIPAGTASFDGAKDLKFYYIRNKQCY